MKTERIFYFIFILRVNVKRYVLNYDQSNIKYFVNGINLYNIIKP